MNMTADPNKRKSEMFGFGYSTSPLHFPRFNDETSNVNPLSTTGTPSTSFYQTNGMLPFKAENSFYTPSENYTLHYSLPSTSSNGFPFSNQIPASTDCSKSIQQSVLHQSPNIFFGSSFNKYNGDKSYTFASISSNARNYTSQPLAGVFGCKRKTNSSSSVPLKQHITEERMAEHMSRLHISSQTASSSETLPTRERRLYMCEEMQRLQTESIIPAQILDKVYRPCTALVPWRPPIVPRITKENNNNDEEPDNNLMDNMDMDS